MKNTTNGMEHQPRIRVVLEAIDAEAITVYYVDAYSSATAGDRGEMRGCASAGIAIVERLIAERWARVSVTRRPVLNPATSTADAEASVLLTAKGRDALARVRAAAAASEKQRAYTLLGRLEMVSHGTVAKIRGASSDGSNVVPLFPPGGVAWGEDHTDGYDLKTHLHFRPLLDACRTDLDFEEVADRISETLERWTRRLAPPQDSLAWREMIGTASGSVREVARQWNVSPSYVHQLRQRHGKRAA